MASLRAEYCPHGCNPNEFGNPGMPLNSSVNATPAAPVLYLKTDPATGNVSEIITMATMDTGLNLDYGAPSKVWLHLSVGGDNISCDLTLVNKTATRFAEAGFFTFDPVQSGSGSDGGWAMDKLGEVLQPCIVLASVSHQ